jgi:hypothetical protein
MAWSAAASSASTVSPSVGNQAGADTGANRAILDLGNRRLGNLRLQSADQHR